MKLLFTLWVVVRLLIDLAMPSLPGAFWFDVDESVLGVRVQSVQTEDLKPGYGSLASISAEEVSGRAGIGVLPEALEALLEGPGPGHLELLLQQRRLALAIFPG